MKKKTSLGNATWNIDNKCMTTFMKQNIIHEREYKNKKVLNI